MIAVHMDMPAPCYLLLVPLEIRHTIYRNLLLDPCLAYFSPKVEGVHVDRNLSNTEDPFGGDFDHDAAESLWEDIDDEDDDGDEDYAECVAVKRHPAILRVNQQIYAEASSLMYSELEIVLQPNDVMDFDHRTDNFEQDEQEWRRNLLPYKVEGAPCFWPTGGFLEPYIFERFQKIGFCANFFFSLSHQHTQLDWTLFADKDFTARPEDRMNYASFLRAVRTVQNLVKLLSMNPVVKRLNHSLYIVPQFESDPDDLTQHHAVDLDKTRSEAATERAIEIFLGAGMLEPLRELSNVENFQFVVYDLEDMGKALKLQQKHAAMVGEVKGMLERNYAAKQACLDMGKD